MFFVLYKAYIDPQSLPSDNIGHSLLARRRKANVSEALRILRTHAAQLDTVAAIRLIPTDAPLAKVYDALKAVLERTKNRAAATDVRRTLSTLAKQQQALRVRSLQSARVLIDQDVECGICRKRITTSAFVRFPNAQISHYFCYKKSLEADES